jgi:hypothetical protein
MKLNMFGAVGRATAPADIGRHGGRPYGSTRYSLFQSFFFDLTGRSSGQRRRCTQNPCMKLDLAGTVNRLNVEHRTSNIERRIMMTLRFI